MPCNTGQKLQETANSMTAEVVDHLIFAKYFTKPLNNICHVALNKNHSKKRTQ